MKNYKLIAAVAAAGLALSAATTQAQITLTFDSTVGSYIEFTGNQFNFVGGFTIATAGPAAGFNGTFTGGPFTFSAPVTGAGGVQTAAVNPSPAGILTISDGVNNLTANINWVELESQGAADQLNDQALINLTGLTYSGSNTALKALASNPIGSLDVTFIFTPTQEPLTALTNSSSSHPIEDSYQGSVSSAVPEPSTVVAGALMLLPLGIGAIRALRKERTA